MVKKGKTDSSKVKVPGKKKMTAREREELLVENFVGLQKAMTNLSIKFESLSNNILKLLHIFEMSAKNFVAGRSVEGDKDLLKKIDSLLEQNKTIAHGLILLEGKLRSRAEVQPRIGAVPSPMKESRPKPLPRT